MSQRALTARSLRTMAAAALAAGMWLGAGAHAHAEHAATGLRRAIERFEAGTETASGLTTHRQALEEEDVRRRRQFARAAAKALPAKALQRLEAARLAYEDGQGRLLAILRELTAAPPPANAVSLAREAGELARKLEAARESEPISADTLPVGAPEMLAPSLGAAMGGASTPVGAVPPSLAAAAASLPGPVEVYEYVRNTLKPDFYYGVMRGGAEALAEGSANDADSASVLVFMLRAKGIPARYVRGTIQVSAAALQQVTGTGSVEQAVRVLARAGIPHEVVLGPGAVAGVKMERVWVEAYVPYTNYRGLLLSGQGKTWIPLDPGWKRLAPVQGVDVARDLGFDARAAVDEYLEQPRTQAPREFVRARVSQLLAQGMPGRSYEDVLNRRLHLPETYGLLPSSLPYTLLSVVETSYELPEPLHHRVRLHGQSSAGTVLDVTLPVAELLGKRLTLSYEAYDEDDAAVAAAFGGLHATPPYLVDVRAVVKSGGVVIASGDDPIGLGVRYTLRLELQTPSGVQALENRVLAGNLTAIGLGGRAVTGPETPASKAAAILAGQARQYLELWNASDEELADLMHVVPVRPTVSVCLVASAIQVDYAGGDPLYPLTFEWKGLAMDADRRSSAPVGIQGRENERAFLLLSGLEGSTLEAHALAQLGVASISTNDVLAQARASGQTIHEIDSGNVDAVLPLLPFGPSVLAEIEDAARRGRHVTVPGALVTRQAWTGVGYRILDEATGEAAYQLQGGYSGGVTVAAVIEISEDVKDPLAQQDEDVAPSEGDDAVRHVRVFESTDFQMGTVGKPLADPLKVLVTDAEGFPVKGAAVRFRCIGGGVFLDAETGQPTGATFVVLSDEHGEASATLRLGLSTREIPRFADTGHTHPTQVGMHLVDVQAGTASLPEPVSAFAFPDYGLTTDPGELPPSATLHLKQLYGTPGRAATPLTVADRMGVSVTDPHDNPISNYGIRFKYASHEARPAPEGQSRLRAATETPGKVLRPEDFSRCLQEQGSPGWGTCAGEAEEVVVGSSPRGAFAYALLGDSPYSAYWFEIAPDMKPAEEFTYRVPYSTTGLMCYFPDPTACRPFDTLPQILANGVFRYVYGIRSGATHEAYHVGAIADFTAHSEVVWEEEEVFEGTDPVTGETIHRIRGTNRWRRDPLTGSKIQLTPETAGTTVEPGLAVETGLATYRSTIGVAPTPQLNTVKVDFELFPPVPPIVWEPLPNGLFRATDEVPADTIYFDVEAGGPRVRREASSTPWKRTGHFNVWGIEPKIANVAPGLPIELTAQNQSQWPSTIALDIEPAEYRNLLEPGDVLFELRSGKKPVLDGHSVTSISVPAGTPLSPGSYTGQVSVLNASYAFTDVQSDPARIDACFLVDLETPRVSLSAVRDPDGLVGGAEGCASDGTIVFNLCRPSHVTIAIRQVGKKVEEEFLLAPIGGTPELIPIKNLLLPAGRHHIPVLASRYLNFSNFTVIAVDEENPQAIQSMDGTLASDENTRPITPIGRTFVKGVDLFDGHLVHQATDLQLQGRHLGLEVSRTYSSAGRGTAGEMGSNWSWNYASRVTPSSCGLVHVTTADGNGVTFRTTDDGQTFTPQNGYHVQLERDAASGGYVFIDRAGTRHVFADVTEPSNPQSPRRLAYLEEPHGDRIAVSYDGDGQVSKVCEVQPGRGEVRCLEVHYERFGMFLRIADITSPKLGLTLKYDYDTFGNLTEAKREDRVFVYHYSVDDEEDRSQLLEVIDPNGGVTKYAYYGKLDPFPVPPGNTSFVLHKEEFVKEVREIPSGQEPDVVTKFVYDFTEMATGRFKPTVTDGNGHDTLYVLNVHGSPLEIHEPMGGKVTRMAWNLVERVREKEIDALGRETRYQHDGNGNLTEERIFAKGLEGDPEVVTEVVTTYEYDQTFNKLKFKRDAEERETTYTIGPKGDVEGLTDAEGNQTVYTYDEHGQLTKTTDPRGYDTLHTNHNDFGHAQQSTDPEGITTSRFFTARGRLWFEEDSLGRRRTIGYDTLDRVTSEMRQAGRGSPSQVTMTPAYYPNGEPKVVVEPGGARTTFTLDGMNRVIETSTRGMGLTQPVTTSARYDANGNKTEETDRRGVRRRLHYNDLNQLERVEIVGGPAPKPIGNVKILTPDLLGNVKEEKDHAGLVTRYEHDGLYRVRKRFLPEAPYFEEYGYDLVGNRTLVKDANGHETQQHYDGLNRVVETINALGQTTRVTYADPEGTSKVNKAQEHDLTRRVRTTFTYDRANREKTRTVHLEGAGGTGQAYLTKTDYDAAAHAYTVTDPEGGQTTYTLDGLDRVAEKAVLVEGDRLVTLTTYDGLGNVRSVLDPRQHPTQHFYDALGRRTLTMDAKREVAGASYDGGGLKLTERDRRRIERTFDYDNLGRLTRTSLPASISPVGWSQETEYLDVQRKRLERDARGHVTTYELDGLDRPKHVFDGVHARPLVITYDGVNKRTETDRRGHTTSFDYDKLNRLTTTSDPEPFEAQTQVTTYDDALNLRTVKDRRGILTVTQLDPLGRVVTVTRAGGLMERNEYDGNGNKTLGVDGEGKKTKFEYDDANRLRVRVDGFESETPSITSFSYDKAGNLERERDARAAALNLPYSSKKTYDSLNRVERETNGNNETTVYGYDEEGNRTSVQEPKGQVTELAYDELGKLLRVTQPAIAGVRPETSYAYDANRNRIRQTDGNGNVVGMEYDGLNRLTFLRQDPDGLNLVTEHRYDENGNERTLIDPKKQTVTSTYDTLNRLETKTYAFAETDTAPRPWRHTTGVVYTYDPNNNVKTVEESVASGTDPPTPLPTLVAVREYDDFDRLLSETTTLPDSGGNKTVGYSYFRNGTRETVTLDGVATNYDYDGQNRLRTATPDGSPATTYEYFGDGLLKTITYPNGVVATHRYDNADRLEELTNAKGGTVVSRYQYGYDPNGNRLSQTETLGGVTEPTTYTYDSLNRLETVTYPADAAFPNGRLVTYGYDRAGNRKTEVTTDPTTSTVLASKTGTFDVINRLTTLTDNVDPAKTTAFSYDDNGNQLSKTVGLAPAAVRTDFIYDVRDKLVEAKRGTSIDIQYQHDAFGRLIRSFDDQGVKQYVYDGTSRVAEYYSSGFLLARYDYGDRLIRLTHQAEGQRYYSYDALGSVTALTDPLGATTASYHLDAWGVFRQPSETAASQNRFGFTGYVYSPLLNLYYANARFYDPEVGRFTSQDSYLGKIDDPPSLHRYFYANDNPTRYVDPTGHAYQPVTPAEHRVEADFQAAEEKRYQDQAESNERAKQSLVVPENYDRGLVGNFFYGVAAWFGSVPIVRKAHALSAVVEEKKMEGLFSLAGAVHGLTRMGSQQDPEKSTNRVQNIMALEEHPEHRPFVLDLQRGITNPGRGAIDTFADINQKGTVVVGRPVADAVQFKGLKVLATVALGAVGVAVASLPAGNTRLLPGVPGTVSGGSSTALGRNMMESMGQPRSTRWRGHQAMHVIPGEVASHPVLQKVGIHLDDATNGLFLRVPDQATSAMARHRGYHSVYNEVVERALNRMDVGQSVDVLERQVFGLQQRLRHLQLQGTPLYPGQGATVEMWERLLSK